MSGTLAETSYKAIRFELCEGVAVLKLNRPESLNAMNSVMLGEMIDVLDRIRDEQIARCLLITGEGRAFSSGVDLVSGSGVQAGDRLDAGRVLEALYNPLVERMFALPVPIVTAINGMAVGAGCSIALAGDIAVASRSAFFKLAFVSVGLVPDAGATWLLPRLIGSARAKAMAMLGGKIDAECAKSWGMIFEVVDGETLEEVAGGYARRFAGGPTRAYALIRAAMRRSQESTLSESLAHERECQRLAGGTFDFAEGVAAFRERRTPTFRGC